MIIIKNSNGKEYTCKYNWDNDCFLQCGDKGIVMREKDIFQTAFFEAFPKNPNTFIRGEGKTIEEAEEKAWNKLQKYKSCKKHEFIRNGYTNGAGFCKHCGLFKSHAFEPSTKCCICGTPTDWTKDNKNNWYCKEHDKRIPIENIDSLMLSTYISNYRKNIENEQDIDKILQMMDLYNKYYIGKYGGSGYYLDEDIKDFIYTKKILKNEHHNYDHAFVVENMKMDAIFLSQDKTLNFVGYSVKTISDNVLYYTALLNSNKQGYILLIVNEDKLKKQNINNFAEFLMCNFAH